MRTHPGPSQEGDQCLAEQLTLSQPGGQIMTTTILRAPPDFGTLQRPSTKSTYFNIVPTLQNKMSNLWLNQQMCEIINIKHKHGYNV